MLKRSGIPNKLFYRDLKFEGTFKVRAGKHHSFYMYHHGGTIENETFWKGLFTTWETDTGWIWKQLCKCSDVVFDIGANTGIYSLVARSINPSAIIYAFEPSLHTIEKLRQNNSINRFDIICEQLAVSNENGEQVFFDTPDPNQTSASLSPDKLKDWEGHYGIIVEYPVKTVTLSKYIEEHAIKNADLIKLDIEMHEPAAIEGLGKYLTLYKPIIIIEVLSDKAGHKLDQLFGDDFIRLHLKANQTAEYTKQLKVVMGEWNYIVFHRDMESKIRQHTTLTW